MTAFDPPLTLLLLGGGGREHALAWRLAQSPRCGRLIAAPGNAGMARLADCAALDAEDPAAVVAFAREQRVDFVVIGPEAPLAAGVADALTAAGIACFGPSRAAAQLESSKSFTKEVCRACGAPTAAAARFDSRAAALAHLDAVGAPIVVKADGLAAGKGVTVALTKDAAAAAGEAAFDGAFGAAGAAVLIEEMLTGEEASLFALSDGETVRLFGGAQDHKRAFDGDQGPNTGGMGAYAPAPALSGAAAERAMDEIVRPVVAEMARRGTPYRGVLYAGLMIEDGAPRLIEFNARFGDPETQALMRLFEGDLVAALLACAERVGAATTAPRLEAVALDWSDQAALTVVMAAEGYPGAYRKGEPIGGLAEAAAVEGVTLFYAGVQADDGRLLSNGGRVLNVTAAAPDLAEARARAYRAVDRVDWPGGFCRRDIAWRAL